MFKYITSEVKDSVQWITLNRPEVYNAFNEDMLFELQDAFKTAKEDDSVRCVVVTGAGKAFCSGQDLKDFNEKKSTFKEALDRKYNPLIRQMTSLPKPVICGINGVAAGAGLSVALACDYRIAVESASLIEIFINVGLVPDSGSSFTLPRLIGYAKAFEMCATADKVSANNAYKMGLVNKVVTNGAILNKLLQKTSSKFASMPTKAIGMIKDMLMKSFDSNLDEMLELESQYQDIAGNTEDYREGVNSFLEKRKPNFKGV
ncbi:MAG: enoyl-CoA hydratase/isomerase family protein [Ignavibacteriae bacterium]|nr:enoyl-CoA hydratase/isomerase family protein [Ignavibacteriota bacterium]